MDFIKHSRLKDTHALLSPSKYHWLNYSEDRLIDYYRSQQAVERGIRLHNLAKECIELGIKLSNRKSTLNMYVNDAIGYYMSPEIVLYHSPVCYGTADAIGFRNNVLRIFDLKTGDTPAHMEQLRVYAALFCLEYDVDPTTISRFGKIILRIYQKDSFTEEIGDPSEIISIMKTITRFSDILETLEGDADVVLR